MADKSSLQRIGWMFSGLTAAVVLVAALMVHNAVADGGSQGQALQSPAAQIADVFQPGR